MTADVSPRDEFFYRLKPESVLAAVEEAGFSPTGHCQALNSFENRVYDLKLEDGSHVVAKFYRPLRWTEEQIKEEHAFLFELQEHEIPVCAPLPFPDGSTLHAIDDIFFAVWPRTGGRSADELSDEQLRLLGRHLGRMHNVGAGRAAHARMALTSVTHAVAPLAFLIENNFLPVGLQSRYEQAVYRIVRVYDEVSQGVPVHRIHGDCHQGNILFSDTGCFFLDFDDFVTGPAVQDFWMIAPALDADGIHRRSILIEAYRSFREFNDSWLRLVGPLRAFRYVHYAAWIARRWQDPAFPAAFPHFGTDEYWENETRDLERLALQIERDELDITGPSPDASAPAARAEDELTNKDFFWDWE